MKKAGYDALSPCRQKMRPTRRRCHSIPFDRPPEARHLRCASERTPKMIVVNMEESFARANAQIKDIRPTTSLRKAHPVPL